MPHARLPECRFPSANCRRDTAESGLTQCQSRPTTMAATLDSQFQQHDHLRPESGSFPPDSAADHILESITDAFYALDHEWRFTYVNAQAERLVARRREDLLGRSVWDEFPEAVGSAFEREYRHAVEDQVAISVTEFFPPLDTWFEVRAFPSEDGLSVFFQNVNERRRQEQALRESEERYRLLVDGMKDYGIILMDLNGHVTSWNAGAERITGWREAEALGQPIDLIFTPEDRAAAVPAQELDSAAAEERARSSRWHMKKDGLRFFADGVLETMYDEKGKACGFTKILRDVTEAKQAEDDLRASAEALRQSGESLRDAQARLEAALTAGGVATWLWDVATDRVVADANLARLFSVSPEDAASGKIDIYLKAIHPEDRPSVVQTIEDALAHHTVYGAEYRVVLPDGSHRWLASRGRVERDATGQAIALPGVVEDITERKALESERAALAERERNISQQLQDALQPELPSTVLGLALSRFYEAALAQSEGVGGDFYDVFALEKGRTALVVGDLSGKGLAAAAQVSIVRNMLRYVLYTCSTVAQAVTELNRVLAEKDLLTGFTTLFVGIYDSASRSLDYVNCGQEPALVRRASTGDLEQLRPTGPILGAFAGAHFMGAGITLAPGDTLAIFTDGLTEIGASRTTMLGMEGVSALLAEALPSEEALSAEQRAEALALSVIAGIDRFAQTGIRDDMCLLIAVVDGG